MSSDAYQELGEALRENRLERAAELCAAILAVSPDNVEVLSLAGTLARRRGDLETALHHFGKAAVLHPAIPEVQNNAGVLLEELGRFDEAASRYRQAVGLRPGYFEGYCNLGNALRLQQLYEEADSSYRTAISINPAYADAWAGLGHTLRAQGKWQEAAESYRKLVELQPGHVAGWTNQGGCYLALNRVAEALECGRRALAIDAANPDAHWNLAHALLASGDLRQGFHEYEWRLKLPGSPLSTRFAGRPLWDGSPLSGKTLLVRAEQGFGDTIQFFRYLPLLARQGVRLVLECRPELLPLLSRQDPGVPCIASGDDPPPFDAFVYLMSLPHLLGTTMETIPAPSPYLAADADLAAEWGRRMPAGRGLRIGLVWAGSAGFKNDGSRSLPLHVLSPLVGLESATLFSLQLGAAAAELTAVSWGAAVHDLSAQVRDFADTAAIIANLDLVVSVDTAVAHLAAAMGKPVFLMLPFASEWRWLQGRADSPWYPTARLYRQREPGAWSKVIAGIVRDLSPQPDDLNRLFREANSLRAAGRCEDAVAAYQRIIALRPDLAEVHNNLGMALQDQGRLEEAAQSYRRALELKPELADSCNNLGTVLVSLGEREEAIPFFRKAIALREDFIPAYVNLGSCLQYLERPEEAVPLYLRAIELQPRTIEARINLGNAYQEMMQPHQAISAYQEALRLDPHHPEAHWNLALSLLSVGDFQRGWGEYEWRLHGKGCGTGTWDGGSLRGKTILLHCEQGLGDTLQFVRYAPLVAALGGRVILQCQYSSLKPLLEKVPGVAAVFARGEELPTVDCSIPLLSLPRIFGTTLERLPATVPYLLPDLGRVTRWNSRIGRGGDFKVGLVWRGGPLPKNRACPYGEFAPLAALSGVTFYSLQLGDAPDQRVLPAVDLAPGLSDFAETAAVLANLDLLISVDTAAAHLAGGMGIPVWTILPHACDWRWMVDSAGSPWYPTMRIFRQQSRGDWKGVVLALCRELSESAQRRLTGSQKVDGRLPEGKNFGNNGR